MTRARETAPVKPFTPPRLIDVAEFVWPTRRVIKEEGVAFIVKSTKWKRIDATEWVRVPFVPVTVTL